MRIASSTKTVLKITALSAVLAVGGLTLGGLTMPGDGAAWAQGQGGQGQGQGGGGQGGGGAGGQGGGQGQGGPGEDFEGRGGPQSGGQADTRGKPVWAQEGLPEVEMGRLNVVRSPDRVIDRALAEALAEWTPEKAAFYELTLEEMIDELSLNWDNIEIYDSPLQNLGLLKDVLADGQTQLDVDNTAGTLAAVFLGVASDKTVPVTADIVTVVTTIMGYPVTEDSAASLAAAAEAIRIAVLAGHG